VNSDIPAQGSVLDYQAEADKCCVLYGSRSSSDRGIDALTIVNARPLYVRVSLISPFIVGQFIQADLHDAKNACFKILFCHYFGT